MRLPAAFIALALTSLPLAAQAPADEVVALFSAGEATVDGRALPFRLLSPAAPAEGERYPLVLFLHGMGERGSDNRRQLAYLPEWMATPERRAQHPCFLLAPQCPEDTTWNDVDWRRMRARGLDEMTWSQRAVVAALREVLRRHPVDPDRVFLTGLSMGGFGAWELAARHPEWFAACVPVCGGGDPAFGRRLVGLPIWAWHGAEDRVVPPAASRDMVAAVGAPARLTELEGVGHDSWRAAYGAEGAIDWMFEQRRAEDRELPGLVAIRRTTSLRPGERIAFLGDSITQAGAAKGGYVDLVRTALAERGGGGEVAVIPAGISGNRVPDLEARLERDVLAKGATVVFVYIGINDVWHSKSGRGTSAEDYEAGLGRLLDRIAASGATAVLATPTVIGERPRGENELDAMLDRYAGISRRVASERGVFLLDLRREMTEALAVLAPEGRDRGALTTDGVHLNAAGNRFLADRAALAITAALERRVAVAPELSAARVTGEGWTTLSLADFENVNGTAETWSEKDGVILCSGNPLGGARTRRTYTNFEMVLEWRHLRHAGNSGVFLWCPESAFTDLPPGRLPRSGIEVQVLDLGYEENWEKEKKAPSDWFTSHGDVFPVGASKMKAFTPEIRYRAENGREYAVGRPDSTRSFPTKRLTRPAGEWNHYYIRAINGEVRLWVNGEEVNGGRDCEPATGYLALESEGSPVEFRNLRLRELP